MEWTASSPRKWTKKAAQVGFMSIPDQNIRSLKAMIIYGLKGMAAYYKHALVLGYSDEEIADFIQKRLLPPWTKSLRLSSFWTWS